MNEAAWGRHPAEAPPPPGGRAGGIVGIAGAVLSVALLAGTVWWGYRLAVLDVNGVPVLRAAEGPMRIAPDDPGGASAPHKGLAVNAVVAGGGAPAPAEVQIALAPAPVGLAPEDLAPPQPEAAPPAPPADPDTAMRAAIESALDAALVAGDPGDGLPSSPRPRQRPRAAAQGALADLGLTGVVTLSAAPVAETDPATLRPGTRLAQIGAFETAGEARRFWDATAARAGALFEGKTRVLQPATSAGRAFFRLRVAEFASEDDARRFCTAIEQGDLRCVPVTHR